MTEREYDSEGFPLDGEYEEEDSGDCGGFGQQLYSYGSEQCDWCSKSAECMRETQEWEKRESSSFRIKVDDEK
jgi:hypothetical protein